MSTKRMRKRLTLRGRERDENLEDGKEVSTKMKEGGEQQEEGKGEQEGKR